MERLPDRLVEELARFVMSETIGPEFLKTISRLERALTGIPHALIGGQAVFFRGYRRFSKDVDVGVGGNAREAVKRLVNAGFELLEGSRLTDPETEVQVDVVRMPRAVLSRLAKAEVMDLGGGVHAPVIDLESLLALKVKIGRAQDEADVVELLKSTKPERAVVVELLKRLGEEPAAYDRLVERARKEQASPPPSLDDEE